MIVKTNCVCCNYGYFYPYYPYYNYMGWGPQIPTDKIYSPCCGRYLPRILWASIAGIYIRAFNFGDDGSLVNEDITTTASTPLVYNDDDGYWHGEFVFSGTAKYCLIGIPGNNYNYTIHYSPYGVLKIRVKNNLDSLFDCFTIQSKWVYNNGVTNPWSMTINDVSGIFCPATQDGVSSIDGDCQGSESDWQDVGFNYTCTPLFMYTNFPANVCMGSFYLPRVDCFDKLMYNSADNSISLSSGVNFTVSE